MHHAVVLFPELTAQPRMFPQQRSGERTLTTCAGGDEALEDRALVSGAVGEQPRRDLRIPMQLGQRVRGPAVGTALMNVRAVTHEQLDHRDIPALGGDVDRSVARFAPGQVRVGTVLEQPANAGDARTVIVRPAQDVSSGGTPPRIPLTST